MDSDKTYFCYFTNCNQKFSDEDTFVSHMCKHELAFDSMLSSVISLPDQTPTPTAFLKDCENFGLFQDLTSKNPFDESFRKAAVRSSTEQVTDGISSDSVDTPQIGNVPDTAAILNMIVTPTAMKDTPTFPTPPIELSGSGLLDTPSLDTPSLDFAFPVPVSSSPPRKIRRFDCKEAPQAQVNPNKVLAQKPPVLPKPIAVSTQRAISPKPPSKLVPGAINFQTKQRLVPANSASKSGIAPSSSSPQNVILLQIPNMGQYILTTPANTVNGTVPIVLSSGNRDGKLNATPQVLATAATNQSQKVKLPPEPVNPIKQKLKETVYAHLKTNNSQGQNTTNSQSLISNPSTQGSSQVLSTQATLNSSSLLDDDFRSVESSDEEGYEDDEKRRQKTLERNRAAARRCRKKKKNFIQSLEEKVKTQQHQYNLILGENLALKEEVANLKCLFLEHKDCPVTLLQQNEGRLNTVFTGQSSPPVSQPGSQSSAPTSEFTNHSLDPEEVDDFYNPIE